MELRENRTELERLLGGVWDYEDVGDKKTSLPKWLFALTLRRDPLHVFALGHCRSRHDGARACAGAAIG